MTTAERCAGCGGPADPRVSDGVPWCGHGNCSDHGPADPVMAGARPATGRLVLPDVPAHDDLAGLLTWLTEAFALNAARPIIRAERFGRDGPDGLAVLTRAGAKPINFEPIKVVTAPAKLIEALAFRIEPTDGAVPAFKAEHCRQISYVLRMACGATSAMTDVQETAGLVGWFLGQAQLVEGFTTYGTRAERYEALEQLQSDVFVKQYLRDSLTGGYVIRVGDLSDAARRYLGSTIPHGWLDGRMSDLGWDRAALSAFGVSGREGRRSRHLHFDVYRGLLPADESDTGAVNP